MSRKKKTSVSRMFGAAATDSAQARGNRLSLEALECRTMLASDVVSPWCNTGNPTDIDNDGYTSTLDLALLTRELMHNGSRAVPVAPSASAFSLMSTAQEGEDTSTLFYDVDGDSYVTTLDLASLVHALRNQESEGEDARVRFTYKATATNNVNAAAATQFALGSTIYLHVFVEDRRDELGEGIATNQLGAFAAAMDLEYSSNVSPIVVDVGDPGYDPGDLVLVGSAFDVAFNGNPFTPGEIENIEVSETGIFVSSQGNPQHAYTLRFTANAVGSVTFTGERALDIGEGGSLPIVLQNPSPFAVDPAQVFYGSHTVNVFVSPDAVNDTFPLPATPAINEDSGFTTLAVLANDGITNGTLSITGVSNITGGATVNVINNGTAVQFRPAANFNGAATFQYTVTDGLGNFDTATVTVNVSPVNDPPSAKNDAFTMDEGTSLGGNVLSNNGNGADSDIDGDTLTINTTPVVAPSNGTLELNANGSFTYTPTTNFFGVVSFTYQLLDGHGGTSSATVSITVNNIADDPIAQDDNFNTNEDQTLNGSVLANNGNGADSDADGNTLTVVTTPVTAPQHGSLTLNANGTFIYTPVANYNGSDSFVYRVNDGTGRSDTATVTITIAAQPDAPTARNDIFNTQEEVAVSGNVLANNGNGPDVDNDGDTLTVQTAPVSGPSNGTVTISANGDFTYTPALNFFGQDSFVYRVVDSSTGALTATATVTINVSNINDAPIAVNDNITAVENVQTNGNLFANNANGVDSDPEGNSFQINVHSQPSHGTLTVNANGTFAYTPVTGYLGPDSFTYSIIDSLNAVSNTATVTIAVIDTPDPPVARNDAFAVNEDAALNGNVLNDNGSGADFDPDVGDTLTVDTTPVVGPQHGTLVLNSNGTFTYTPTGNYFGPDSFQYRLRDGTNRTAVGTVSITVNGQPDDPDALNDAFSVNEDATLNGNVLNNNGSGADFDVDGNGLTVSTTPVNGPAHGSLTLNANGTFTYTPSANFNGQDQFTYQVNDGTGRSDTAVVTINVIAQNDPPTARNDAFTINEGATATGNVLSNNGSGADSDIDGNPLSVSTTAVSGPTNGTLALNANGSFTYTPNADYFGADSFVYRLNDGQGATATATVSITVREVNDAPTAVNDRVVLPHGQTTFTFSVSQLLGNDSKGPANESGQTIEVISVQTTGESIGQVSFNAQAGTITYTAPANFEHRDTFTYTIRDNGTTAGSADPKTSTATVEIIDFIPSTLGGTLTPDNEVNKASVGIGGMTITLTVHTDFGETIVVPVETAADGSYEFPELPPGQVTISTPVPLFMMSGSNPATTNLQVQFTLQEGTTNTGLDFGDLGRAPQYYSVRDMLNTTPRKSVMFATNVHTGQHWYSFGEGWSNIVDAEFELSPDRSTITINVVNAQGQAMKATVATAGNYRVEFLGKIGDSHLIRLAGSFSDFSFQPVEVEGEFSLTSALSSGAGGGQIEGEFATSSFVATGAASSAASYSNGSTPAAYDGSSNAASAIDLALEEFDYYSL